MHGELVDLNDLLGKPVKAAYALLQRQLPGAEVVRQLSKRFKL